MQSVGGSGVGSGVQRSGDSKGSPGSRRKQEGARWALGPRLFALCPAEAWWVCVASHQLCTEEKCHVHTLSSVH